MKDNKYIQTIKRELEKQRSIRDHLGALEDTIECYGGQHVATHHIKKALEATCNDIDSLTIMLNYQEGL